MKQLRRWARIFGTALLSLGAIILLAIAWLWRDRADPADLTWPEATSTVSEAGSVSVTWFGITTLLFDDGETQILTDGTFSRVGLLDILSLRRITSDVATVNHALAEFRINRLAAIIPLHSHFDHAMDSGLVANRSSAVILGSESTANIARGASVPVDQYQILANGESRQFGDFTVTLVESRHAPIGFGGKPLFSGRIEEPLLQPARARDWKDGVVYTVVISHPRGSTLVQGSAGFIEGNLEDVATDVVMLGTAGLASLGKEYTSGYWAETVLKTGAERVFPIHHDDFTEPFGEFLLFPDFIDNVAKSSGWLNEFALKQASTPTIELLPLGQPVVLY